MFPSLRRGISLAELLVSVGIIAIVSAVMAFTMSQMTKVWQRNSARDAAMRQLFLVERSLMRDLADSSRRTGRWDTAPVACGAGSLSTGDALAVVVPGAGTEELKIDAAGNQIANQLVTYYLAVAPGIVQAFAPDAAGYEDQCPFKWLIRKNEAASQVPPNWLQGSVIEQPTSLWRDTQRKVVATDLLQLRIRRTPPTWEIEVSAVAIADARRKSALGAQPLSGSVFVIVHRFGVIART